MTQKQKQKSLPQNYKINKQQDKTEDTLGFNQSGRSRLVLAETAYPGLDKVKKKKSRFWRRGSYFLLSS